MSGERSNTSREILSQGLGNMVCGAFGGICAAGSPSRTVANYSYGARTRRSRVVAGVFALTVLVVAGPAVSHMPRVVLAGLLVVLAVGLLDKWILHTGWALLRRKEPDPRVAFTNLVIALLVTGLMLVVGVLQAVAAGLVLSIVYFAVRMGKQVVRRRYNGAELHSSVQRCEAEFSLLEKEGQRIVVLELEGSLFFGTADRVATVLETESEGKSSSIVLDLRLIAELDLTGAKILERSARECDARGTALVLSYEPGAAVEGHLVTHGILELVGTERCFASTNEALGWAEDRLLDELVGEGRYTEELPIESLDALRSLDEAERTWLNEHLVRRTFEAEEVLFEQGAAGDRVFFITQGRVRIEATLAGNSTKAHLASLCPGTLLGELAVVDGRPRSATAVAEGPVVCLELGAKKLEELTDTKPRVGAKILAGICREIATRLRIANRAVR